MPKRKCSEIDKNFGRRLKQYRAICGLTQEQVASVLNINRTTYTKYETGVSEPSQELLGRIVALFGTDFNTILGFIDVDPMEKLRVADPNMRLNNLNDDEQRLISGYRSFDIHERAALMKSFDEVLIERNKRFEKTEI